jgi:hypothetical protein
MLYEKPVGAQENLIPLRDPQNKKVIIGAQLGVDDPHNAIRSLDAQFLAPFQAQTKSRFLSAKAVRNDNDDEGNVPSVTLR